MSRVPVNVKRGIELLDARLPGWRLRVRPDRLDLGSSCGCVLGQVLGDYSEGTELLGIETEGEAARYGFTTYGRQTLASLTEAWKRVLQ